MVFAVVWRSPIVPTDPWHYVRSALEFPSADWVPARLHALRHHPRDDPPGVRVQERRGHLLLLAAARRPRARRRALPRRSTALGRRRRASWPSCSSSRTRSSCTTSPAATRTSCRCRSSFAAVVSPLMARDGPRVAGPRCPAWVVAAGFLLGLGGRGARDRFLLAWPIVLVILWRRGSVLRTYAARRRPVVLWAALDVGISGFVYGDPLLKAHTLREPTRRASATPPAPAVHSRRGRPHPDGATSSPFPRRRPGTRRRCVAPRAPVSSRSLACLRAAPCAPPRRRRRSSPSTASTSSRGCADPEPPVRHPHQPAVLDPVLPLPRPRRRWAGLGRRRGLQAAGRTSRRPAPGTRRLAVALAVPVVCVPPVTHARYYPTAPAFAANGGDALEELRAHLAAAGFAADEVWTDWTTKRTPARLPAPRVRRREGLEGPASSLTGAAESPGPGDAVLLYSARGNVCDHCRRALEPWLEKHPSFRPTGRWSTRTPTGRSRCTSSRSEVGGAARC